MSACKKESAMDSKTVSLFQAGSPVFMLSGQGSQQPGMGQDLFDLSEAQEVFECANDVFGFDVADFIANTSAEKLNDTRCAQPALCVLSVAIARALETRGVAPAAVLGFSLGQISALAVSGMLSNEETFKLVRERSALMAQAAEEYPGAMSALLKADEESVRALCDECAQGQVLVPANFNCPGQIVISGEIAAIARAEEAWALQGKHFSRLATSGAFHSPLMTQAANKLAEYLEDVEFKEPRVPLICNVDTTSLTADCAAEHLVRHLVSPVCFQQSVEMLVQTGAQQFLEVGFGGVLAGLVKRIDKTVGRACVSSRESFDDLLTARNAGNRQ